MRRFNLGNYEHIEIEMIAPVTEGVDRTTMANILHTDIKQVFSDKDLKVTNTVEKKAPVKPKKEEPKEEVAQPKEEVKEEPKKETKKVAKKKVAKKPKKSACVPYDRELKEHKDEFASILNDRCDGWKGSKESLSHAKKLSGDLSGVDMFGPDGNVLGEFADKVVESMSTVLNTDL